MEVNVTDDRRRKSSSSRAASAEKSSASQSTAQEAAMAQLSTQFASLQKMFEEHMLEYRNDRMTRSRRDQDHDDDDAQSQAGLLTTEEREATRAIARIQKHERLFRKQLKERLGLDANEDRTAWEDNRAIAEAQRRKDEEWRRSRNGRSR